ncbi:MAG: cold-shock protein [Bacteroidota bacterium]
MEGTVKFFNESKGYGFITNEDTGQDIFVHVTGLNGETIAEGDRVEYNEQEGRKGMNATDVRVVLE